MAKGLHILQLLQQAGRGDRLLHYSGMGDSISLAPRAELVASALEAILPNWPTDDADHPARIRVAGQVGDFRIQSPWLGNEQTATTPTSAACALIIEMARSWLDAHAGMLCLHCAAFELNGRLIVLAGTNRSGKSTLAAALGAAGARIYCDDMLPLTPEGRGMAFGVPPRLRLPLPETLHGTLAASAAGQLVSSDDRYGYTMPHNLAPHGHSAPLGGIVLLDRVESGGPTFHAVDRSEAVAQLLLRNLHRDIGAGETVTRFLHIAQSVPVISLRYAGIDEAVGTLMAPDYAAWPEGETAAAPAWTGGVTTSPIRTTTPYIHSPDVWTQAVDGDLFAVNPETEDIFRLNPVAAVLWDMFAEPTTVMDAADLLAAAFPDESAEAICADVELLMATLFERGLIRSA